MSLEDGARRQATTDGEPPSAMVDSLAEKRQYFPGLMDSAFDLSSGGMGVHLHAVSAFAARQELTKGAKESLQTSSANYLVNPYVFG